ncbi:ABC transporter permease [Candidatus Endoriftia persephonae]|jgi:ABC-type lipoprotein release transport system permease subunit|uniref:ABC transporter, involved in lipoprotein release, permease protein n=2 Tax=Gammaproteobacteria TaxID=1236 RepID=G2FJN6_9GAMM|nr:FtsX-like permease family protein [Candidatus Endoriftia persephone]EGW52988.1 ABC transporter, involved in lipoprotein release, permease protein [endosymbiont of Tevnia jerichonana (vent Tica)]USF87977.1 ABC transporter permease [Candidatus Endoriftia persephone]
MGNTASSANRLILAVALRSLSDNLRRTLLTVGAIATGLASLIFLWGFNDGLHHNMLKNFQESIIGSLQIHRQGFFENPKLSLHLRHPDQVTQTLNRLGANTWSPRLESFALAASDTTTEGVMLIGMDPVHEPRVTKLKERIGEGRFLQPGDTFVCILGATTARNLKIGLGDSLVLLGYDRFGALVAEEFRLIGIITSGEMGLDRGMALTSLSALQEMLDFPGGVTDLVVRVPEERLNSLKADLLLTLADQDLEVMAWSDMFPVMQEWITLHNGFLYLFLGVVLFIVLAGELNTLLLSMLERTREFGIFMAIGTQPRQLTLMILSEALAIGLLGIFCGILLGIAIVLLTQHTGIDLSLLLGSTTRFYVDPLIYPNLNLQHLGITTLAILLTSLLAGIYPARRVSRLQPAEALRHV